MTSPNGSGQRIGIKQRERVTDHPDHATQARLIRGYIAWRDRNTDNPRLRSLINTANGA